LDINELENYGLPLPKAAQDDTELTARVLAVYKDRYLLICAKGRMYGRLKTAAYYHAGQDFPTVGDFVRLQPMPGGDGQILCTLPRKTLFQRRDPSQSDYAAQAVAANFDYVFIVQSLNADFNSARLERYLAMAWESGAAPVVVLTKSDLTADPAPFVAQAQRSAMGVAVCAVSARTGAGLEALNAYLQPGKSAVLLGSSGVGKSSLVNALAGQSVMAVNDIRQADDKGRHTTTHRQMTLLPGGALLMDTPGMRELGVWTAPAGLQETFADIEQLLGRCKFRDCSHTTEPGCAVRAAIASGVLSRRRWESYQQLQRESAGSAAHAAQRAALQQRRMQRQAELGRRARQIQKEKRQWKTKEAAEE